jgi:hypothetical protein
MSVNKHNQVLTVVLFPPFWRFILSQQHNRENIVCLSVSPCTWKPVCPTLWVTG